MSFRILGVLVWLTFLLGSGCAAVQTRPESRLVRDAGELTDLLRSRERTEPLAGRIDIRVEAPEKQSAHMAFLAAPPESIRADVTTAFGIPVASLASDGRRLSLFQHGDNRYYTGPVSSPAARSLLVVPLSPRELVTLITGSPSMAGYNVVEGSFQAGKNAYAAHYRGPGGRVMTVVVNRERLTVREIFYRFPGRTLHIAFQAWRPTREGLMPELVVVDGGADLHAELSLGSWDFSVAPEPGTFEIPVPPGAQTFVFGAQAP